MPTRNHLNHSQPSNLEALGDFAVIASAVAAGVVSGVFLLIKRKVFGE